MKLSRFPALCSIAALAMDPCLKTVLVQHRAIVFAAITCVPITQTHRRFRVVRQTLVSAHPARSRLNSKVSRPPIFDRIIQRSLGN
jgi:hypothetical protein